MSILSKIFAGNKVQCPRCLSKGNVDSEDIRRLNMELKWVPGPCAYCSGIGTISSKMESKVPVDLTYFTKDLSTEERNRILKGEVNALKRAELYETEMNNFITEVEFLHFKGKMNSELIADFFLLSQSKDQTDKVELIDYVSQIITEKGKN